MACKVEGFVCETPGGFASCRDGLYCSLKEGRCCRLGERRRRKILQCFIIAALYCRKIHNFF